MQARGGAVRRGASGIGARALVAAAAAVVLVAGSVVPAGGREITVPKTFSSALSPADIARLAASPTDRVIILLRNQHAEKPGVSGQRANRASTLQGDQSHITDE